MVLKLTDKQSIVARVSEVASTSVSVVAGENRGLTVGQMTELRRKAREVDVYVLVIRNTLASRAVENTAFICLQPILQGPIILAFSRREPAAAARLIKDFAKLNEKFAVKGVAI